MIFFGIFLIIFLLLNFLNITRMLDISVENYENAHVRTIKVCSREL